MWVDELPRNVMGKVLKHEVRDLIAGMGEEG
jgi:acyl-coenzyme A synthetase/AMP-(fatty) acid ligase